MLNIGYCFSSGVYYEHHNPHCINVQKIDDAITQSHKKRLRIACKRTSSLYIKIKSQKIQLLVRSRISCFRWSYMEKSFSQLNLINTLLVKQILDWIQYMLEYIPEGVQPSKAHNPQPKKIIMYKLIFSHVFVFISPFQE